MARKKKEELSNPVLPPDATGEGRKKIKSKFLEESAKTGDALSMPEVPTLDVALFTATEPVLEEDVVRLNLPPMMKPEQFPIWTAAEPKALRCKVVKIVPSPNSTIKGKLLWLKTRDGSEITFPCTGVIRNALAPGIKDDDAKLEAALEKYVGTELIFKRTPNKLSKYGKAMFMFEVMQVKA